MGDQSSIKERLRRLLSMTVENGATEAEALVAAQKAADLMAEHNLSYRSVEEIEAEAYCDDERQWFRGRKGYSRSAPVPPIRYCLQGISDLCGVEHCFNGYTGKLNFFGAPHDTEAAHYLVVILSRAMEREWFSYKTTLQPWEVRSARASFFYGISNRIAARLDSMCEEQKAAAASTGNALVVVKNAIVKSRFEKRHPHIKASRVNPSLSHGAALDSGWEAGGRVQINQGINEAQGAKLLTSIGEL